MKGLFRIFDLTKSEQRVVLIVMLVLLAIAFIGYQRRLHQRPIQSISAAQAKPSASPGEIEDER